MVSSQYSLQLLQVDLGHVLDAHLHKTQRLNDIELILYSVTVCYVSLEGLEQTR